MDSSQKTKYIIENTGIMVIATSDSTGKPWISPVGFTFDDSYNLYWVSYKRALHSENIVSRPEVAITIFGQLPNGDTDGVYIDAKARELRVESEIKLAITLFTERRPQISKFTVNSVKDVTGDAEWRMYKAFPLNISKRSDKTINGQAITVREPVQL